MPEIKNIDGFEERLQGLYEHLEANPHIQEVHFTEDGNYHLNVHELDGQLYSRIPPEGPADEFKIISTQSRADILGGEESAISDLTDDSNPVVLTEDEKAAKITELENQLEALQTQDLDAVPEDKPELATQIQEVQDQLAALKN